MQISKLIKYVVGTMYIIVLLAGSLFAQGTLTIHHLDVGTGDATLLIMPNGRTLLVDAGLDGAGTKATRSPRDFCVSIIGA